ncbi:hypothetical protein V2A60_009763 [Cordyceps javanica]
MTTNEPLFDDPRFSREYRLPENTVEGRPEALKITYADYGYRNEENPEEENVFLFFPPLLGSRWMHIAKDDLAKKHKVRIINIERPGYGGTDEVEVQDRLRVWQCAIPALLAHLDIKHVSVGCHSAGTVYALDFILHHPQFLHPERPYLAIAGPWIPPAQSGVISMRLAQSMPAAVISWSETWARFMKSTVNPALGAGASAVSSLLGVVARSVGAAGQEEGQQQQQQDEAVSEPTTADGEREMRLRPMLLSKAYSENLQGMGVDAVLMMGKAPRAASGGGGGGVAGGAGWSDWGDYEAYVPRLVEALRASGRRLTVDAFHAETDSMVGDYGEQGPTWFDGCWAAERCGEGVITYKTSGVEDADHDLVWSIKFGVPETVFTRISCRGKPDQRPQDDVVADTENVAAQTEDAAAESDNLVIVEPESPAKVGKPAGAEKLAEAETSAAAAEKPDVVEAETPTVDSK